MKIFFLFFDKFITRENTQLYTGNEFILLQELITYAKKKKFINTQEYNILLRKVLNLQGVII